MPDKFFEEIFNAFDKAYYSNLDTIDRCGVDVKKSVEQFWIGFKQLVDIQNNISAKYAENGKIDKSDYDFLLETYDQFKEKSDKYLEMQNSVLYGVDELSKFDLQIESIQTPLKQYAEDIRKGGPDVNLTEVYKDKRWIEDLFATDPQTQIRKNEAFVPFEADELSKINDCTIAYAETVNNIKEKYEDHLKTVTGSKNNPYEAMQVKQKLMQSVMTEKNVQPDKIPFIALDLAGLHKTVGAPLYIDKITELTDATILNNDFFESIVNKLIDHVDLRGNLEKTSLDKNTVNHIMAAYKKLKFTPENIGITPTELDTLQKSSEVISLFSTISRTIDSEPGLNSHKENLSSFKFAKKKCEEVKAKILNNLKGNDPQPVSDDDIKNIMDGFTDYASRTPRFNANMEENGLVKMSMDFCRDLAETFPTLKPYYAEKENDFKEAAQSSFNQVYTALSTEKGTTKMGRIFSQGRTLCHEGLLDESYFDKLYILSLAKNKKFREQELKAATQALAAIDNDEVFYGSGTREFMQGKDYTANNGDKSVAGKLSKFEGSMRTSEARLNKTKQAQCLARTILLATYFNKELDACAKFANAENEKTKCYTNGYNEKIAQAVTGNKIPENELGNLDELTRDFYNNPAVNVLMNKSPEDIKAAMFSGVKKEDDIKTNFDEIVEEKLYGNSSIFIGKLDKNSLESIATVKKGPSKKNSESYTDMTNKLEAFNKAAHNMGGLKDKDYGDMFNTLKKYIETHDSDPFTDHGKARFNAAATLLCDVGLRIKQLHPTANEINRNIDEIFKVTMVRSKVFREACLAKADSYGAAKLKDVAETINANLAKDNKTMITGKLDSKSKQNKMKEMAEKYSAKQAVMENM